MCKTRMFLLIATALLPVSGAAQARISHGYSAVFAIDTVTAVDEHSSDQPQATTLAAIYPNPFNPRTTIGYELAEAAEVQMAIYDSRGMLVRVLEIGSRPSGRHRVTWDGQDDSGRAVASGMYFCRLSTPQGSRIGKLTLAR